MSVMEVSVIGRQCVMGLSVMEGEMSVMGWGGATKLHFKTYTHYFPSSNMWVAQKYTLEQKKVGLIMINSE